MTATIRDALAFNIPLSIGLIWICRHYGKTSRKTKPTNNQRKKHQ